MSRAAALAGAALVLAAAALAATPARAFVRTCDASSGACLWWPSPTVPWRLDPAGQVAPSCTADLTLAAARAAFAAWQDASTGAGRCTSLELPFDGYSSSTAIGRDTPGEHLVVLRGGWCSVVPPVGDACRTAGGCNTKYNCFDDASVGDRQILALTTVFYIPSTGRIVDADIEVVGWDGRNANAALPSPPGSPPDGWYFTCLDPTSASTPPNCNAYGEAGCVSRDLQNVLTHEAGHFVGFAHNTSDADSTMYSTTSARDVSRRSLTRDDAAGMCDTYPYFDTAGPGGGPWQAPVRLAPGNGGCASGGDGTWAALFAALALLPRLSRVRYNGRTWRGRRRS